MDWTQALSQFAGGFANADLRRRQLAEQKRQREAVAKAQGARWEMDYKLKQEELAAKKKSDNATASAKSAAEKRDRFETALAGNTSRLSSLWDKATALTDPISSQYAIDQLAATWNQIRPGLEIQYNDPDIRSFYDPSGRLSFDDYVFSRMGIPVVTGTTGRGGRPIPVDVGAIAKEANAIVDEGTKDVLTGKSPEYFRDRLAPLLGRMRMSGRTDDQIFQEVPALAYGIQRQVPVTQMVPEEGASWTPMAENQPVPGARPSFGEDTVFGNYGYRVGLPAGLRDKSGQILKGQNFIDAVSQSLAGNELIDFVSKGLLASKRDPVTGADIPYMKRPFSLGSSMERASKLLENPAFMEQLGPEGIKSIDQYDNPDIQREAIGRMFASLPKFATSKAGQAFEGMLQSGPIETTKLKPVQTTEVRTKMPLLPATTMDEAAKRKADIEGRRTQNAIDNLKLDLGQKTFNSDVAIKHAQAVLPWLKYNLDVDRNKWQRQAALGGLDAQFKRISLDAQKMDFNANKFLTFDVPTLIGRMVGTANNAVETQGKALGSALNQSVISALVATDKKLDSPRIYNIVKTMQEGGQLSAADKKYWTDEVEPKLSQVPAGKEYFDAKVRYDEAYATYKKYLGIQSTYTDYVRRTISTMDPYEQVESPESIFPGVEESNTGDSFDWDSAEPTTGAAESPVPSPAKPTAPKASVSATSRPTVAGLGTPPSSVSKAGVAKPSKTPPAKAKPASKSGSGSQNKPSTVDLSGFGFGS